jgi:hypothetical protein
MAIWELFFTWALLAIIGFGMAGLSKQLEQLREELHELREKITGEDNFEGPDIDSVDSN